MNIVIAGGSGFIGTKLTEMLINNGHHVYILTRNTNNKINQEKLTYIQWLNQDDQPEKMLPTFDAVINLAGESLNSGRWTTARKKQILESRIESTQAIIKLLEVSEKKPKVLISASAVGFYGTSTTKVFTEVIEVSGSDFLASVVSQWEETAMQANAFGIRTVLARLGVVLDKKGGALPKMLTPYHLFAGGTVGSGDQWLSWIHIEDAVRLLLFALEHEDIRGPVNVTAPHPVDMKTMGKEIGKVLHRPHWLPAPGFALKLLMGEMSVLVLEGQKVLPKSAQDSTFSFLYPNLNLALKDLLLR